MEACLKRAPIYASFRRISDLVVRVCMVWDLVPSRGRRCVPPFLFPLFPLFSRIYATLYSSPTSYVVARRVLSFKFYSVLQSKPHI